MSRRDGSQTGGSWGDQTEGERSKAQPHAIHNPFRELNSRSSITEPAAGRSWDDITDSTNPYLNDDFMANNRNQKSALRYSKTKVLRKGESSGSLSGLVQTKSTEKSLSSPQAVSDSRKKVVSYSSETQQQQAPQSSDEISSSSATRGNGEGQATTTGVRSKGKEIKNIDSLQHSRSTNDIVFLTDSDLAPLPFTNHTPVDIAYHDNPHKKGLSIYGHGRKHHSERQSLSGSSATSSINEETKRTSDDPARRRAKKGKNKQLQQDRDKKRESLEGFDVGTDAAGGSGAEEEAIFLSSLAAFGVASQRADRNVLRHPLEDGIISSASATTIQFSLDDTNDMASAKEGPPSLKVLQALERAKGESLRSITSETSSSSNTRETEAPSLTSVVEEDDSNLAGRAGFITDVNKYGSPEVSKPRMLLNEMSSTASRTIVGGSTKKKKLILENMDLAAKDIPLDAICSRPLGPQLHKLSLAGNRLQEMPQRLALELHGLHTLDLQQCDLIDLPTTWNLKALRRLILSHNKLEYFDEDVLNGLPELRYLDLYGNKLCDLILPEDSTSLRLEYLNVGFNNLTDLPDELTQIKTLRVVRAPNNLIKHVSARFVEGLSSSVKEFDVTANPLIQPPLEDCERGIEGMRRYYSSLAKSTSPKGRPSRKSRLNFRGGTASDKKESSVPKAPQSKSETAADCVTLGAATIAVAAMGCLIPGIVPQQPSLLSLQMDKHRELFDDWESVEPDHIEEPQKHIEHQQVLHKPSEARLAVTDHQAPKLEDTFVSSEEQPVYVNDTLKIIFVGMSLAGKTSMIQRLIKGNKTILPQKEHRTIGVDILEWDPMKLPHSDDPACQKPDTSIIVESSDETRGPRSRSVAEDAHIKFSVWDFAGQDVYHSTHQLFFSPRALYVLAWDMGVQNPNLQHASRAMSEEVVDALSDDSDEEVDGQKALERDIDEKVQFWVDCIQASIPGAVILPVATFNDFFDEQEGGEAEAKRRCDCMRARLLKHEKRRVEGLRQRLLSCEEKKEANSDMAIRIQQLLAARPKLVFAGSKQYGFDVLRVSSSQYSGFCKLREKIINVATGRDLAGSQCPLFRGHVGAIIPRVRVEVRKVIREQRKELKVVEIKHLLSILRKHIDSDILGNDNNEVYDALLFLSNIGELSFFGRVGMHLSTPHGRAEMWASYHTRDSFGIEDSIHSDSQYFEQDSSVTRVDDDDKRRNDKASDAQDEDDNARPGIRKSTDSSPSEISTLEDFVFLNRRWLVAVVACVLRHDLQQAIADAKFQETLKEPRTFDFDDEFMNSKDWQQRGRLTNSPYAKSPIVTSDEVCMLWRAKSAIIKAAKNSMPSCRDSPCVSENVFDFLQDLLTRFNVLVPVDLNLEEAQFGGKTLAKEDFVGTNDESDGLGSTVTSSQVFLLPSLLGPSAPPEQIWTHKTSEAYMTAVCVSWRFPDGCPPGFMERVIAYVLRALHATSATRQDSEDLAVEGGAVRNKHNEKMKLHRVFCWRTAFMLQLGKFNNTSAHSATAREEAHDLALLEIFGTLVDRDDPGCVAAQATTVGTQRLVLSAKGRTRRIWSGGFELVTSAIDGVLRDYGGLVFEKEAVCPECLQLASITLAQVWSWNEVLRDAGLRRAQIRCGIGHRVDTSLVSGKKVQVSLPLPNQIHHLETEPLVARSLSAGTVPVKQLFQSVVLIALWDPNRQQIKQAGSGFVVDAARGLIVTASHTLIRMTSTDKSPFGEYYYGIPQAKVLIGVLPTTQKQATLPAHPVLTAAVFRYSAQIVQEDVANLDACVLKIRTRFEDDVTDANSGIVGNHEIPLVDKRDFKRQNLHALTVSSSATAEVEEEIRLIGFNQGGEGMWEPGAVLDRNFDYAPGRVIKHFHVQEHDCVDMSGNNRRRFWPRHELIAYCPTIGGHSGGPCVNKLGQVIGILSRAEGQQHRAYLVPSTEFMPLVETARRPLEQSTAAFLF